MTKTYLPHVLSNLNMPEKYFNTLPANDISRCYYNGEVYSSNFFSRLSLLFSIGSTISELKKFYPYQPIIDKTYKAYNQSKKTATDTALVISGVSVFSIYQLAKRGVTLNVLRKFGRVLKIHRIGRQYLYALTLPYLLLHGFLNFSLLNHVENLWAIHSRRLNQKRFEDPEYSKYPREILPISFVKAWQLPLIHAADKPKKWANEVNISIAPDYIQPEFEAFEIPDEAGEDATTPEEE